VDVQIRFPVATFDTAPLTPKEENPYIRTYNGFAYLPYGRETSFLREWTVQDYRKDAPSIKSRVIAKVLADSEDFLIVGGRPGFRDVYRIKTSEAKVLPQPLAPRVKWEPRSPLCCDGRITDHYKIQLLKAEEPRKEWFCTVPRLLERVPLGCTTLEEAKERAILQIEAALCAVRSTATEALNVLRGI